jgi:hypothetical protein
MTVPEKQLMVDLFNILKELYYKQKVTDEFIERMLRKLPKETILPEEYVRIEIINKLNVGEELEDLETRINELKEPEIVL